MSIINSQPLIGASGQQGYTIAKSLRFRSSASAYLNRTPASAGNLRMWTLSWWTKRGQLSTASQVTMFGTDYTSNQEFQFQFRADNKLVFEQYTAGGATFLGNLISTQVFRDPAAWYHIVVTWDSAQSTSSNRIKVYVNGVQITAWDTASYPAQNSDSIWNNSTNAQFIGKYSSAKHYDGYMTEINFIDGQSLTPSSFGETSASTGVWIPKKYTGTYGTNGFYLDFKDTSSVAALGYDAAGSNDWTVNNVSLTSGSTYDSMTDVPTLTSATAANYAVLSPIDKNSAITVAQVNLSYTSSNDRIVKATISATSGKFYWEFAPGGGGSTTGCGVINPSVNIHGAVNLNIATAGVSYLGNGNKSVNGTATSYGATYTSGDVIGVALNLDGNTITFYKNNSSQGAISISSGLEWSPAFDQNTGTNYVNFGQQPFAYTPPTGFVALNTFNLPTPTIGATGSSQANKYFDVTTYTGTGSTLAITNSGSMQPDFVWTKARSNVVNNILVDAVRGGNKIVFSDLTNAEQTSSFIDSFNSNGWTVNSAAGTGGNQNGYTYVAWQWRASNTTAVSNTAGSITSTVSANTTAGFSIVTYTGNNTLSTVGHGLGVSPAFIIVKDRSASNPCVTYHQSLGVQYYTLLNATDASYNNLANYWGSSAPTSTTFSINAYGGINTNGDNYVAYCFAQVAGYSAFGRYTGNGSSDGPFVFTGFRPRFFMVKRTDSANDWVVLDTSRNTFNVMTSSLFPNSSSAETSNGFYDSDMLSNGIKIRATNSVVNASGGTYIYMALAENPFKFSNAR